MQPLRSDAPRSLAIAGHLVCVIENHPRFRSDQPPDSIWLFRSGSTWTTLTLRRRETRLGHDRATTMRIDTAGQVYVRLDRPTRIGERNG